MLAAWCDDVTYIWLVTFAGEKAVRKDRERVTRALDCLSTGLAPYVERSLVDVYHADWRNVAQQSFRDDRGTGKSGPDMRWDAHALLTVMWDQWNRVFRGRLQGLCVLARPGQKVDGLRKQRNGFFELHTARMNPGIDAYAQVPVDLSPQLIEVLLGSVETVRRGGLRLGRQRFGIQPPAFGGHRVLPHGG